MPAQLIRHLLEHPSLLAYFSGADNYTWLQFRSGERRLLAKPLTFFEEKLPSFVRIHKKALVNPAYVTDIQQPTRAKMPGVLRMMDGTELPVSRRRWPEINQFFQTFQSQNEESTPPPVAPQIDTETPRRVVMTVMTGDALALTRQRFEALAVHCQLQAVDRGAELANLLLLSPEQQWPALILLDARTHKADRMLTLRSLKGNRQLRAIPIVWLASPGDEATAVLALDVNSVVEVPDESALFVRIIDQICHYWLMLVQLPPNDFA